MDQQETVSNTESGNRRIWNKRRRLSETKSNCIDAMKVELLTMLERRLEDDGKWNAAYSHEADAPFHALDTGRYFVGGVSEEQYYQFLRE
jgi:hypothetical protein